MRVPLFNRLKRQIHREIGLVQDRIVEAIYSLEENPVLHGGTAIWRCFQGNRFSEDLDFYFLPKKNFKEAFAAEVASAGFVLEKFKQTEATIYSKIVHGSVIVSVEVALREFKNPVVKEFERVDGSFLDVFVPSAEDLLLEKLAAFKSRKLVRDIFDVYHLSNFVEEKPGFNEKVSALLEGLPVPLDEKNLRTIVLSGAVPSFEQMQQALERRFQK